MTVNGPLHGKKSYMTLTTGSGDSIDVPVTDFNLSMGNSVASTGTNNYVGVDITADRTVAVSVTMDPEGVMTIQDMVSQPTKLWGEGIVDYKIMEDLKELSVKHLAALILMLPAGNNIRELARRVLKEKTPGEQTETD